MVMDYWIVITEPNLPVYRIRLNGFNLVEVGPSENRRSYFFSTLATSNQHLAKLAPKPDSLRVPAGKGIDCLSKQPKTGY